MTGGPVGASTVIRGGTVLDAGGERRADVVVVGDVVAAVGADLVVPPGARVLDAGGCLVAPGLVDLHAHLRQPGHEEAETVETGARAAALGGFSAVVAMPNTEPPMDAAGVVREVLDLGRDAAVEVAVAGAITEGRRGERLAPMAELSALGVHLFTDDGRGVQDGALMRRALDYARGLGVVLAQHCEDEALASGGSMHEGAWSGRLGVAGIPSAAEEVMVARDIALVRLTGARLHFQHLSTAGSVELVRRARAEGLPVTAEATPHHLVLTDAALEGYDPVFKVNPPLRTPADVAAVRHGVADGTVDAIATDHAPHAPETKEQVLDQAPPGMLGLETALPLALAALTAPGGVPGPADLAGPPSPPMTRRAVFGALSWRPAAIAGLTGHGGPIAPGSPAHLCVYDPSTTWTVTGKALASRSRNTPYEGWRLTGRVRHTLVGGAVVVLDAEAQQ